ncbi:hypothetical protein BROUX41_005722 [Berkeleyomyces rouxiae]|uniref:uncharacterized protein n=1 Tax=Berkeleyomyces rouxiae TaxID=2035830 RepID=UPI003B7C1FFD
MCHYDMSVWLCRNWRWEGFRERCNRVRRIGETCGLKLVYNTDYIDKVCNMCEKAAKKERRLEKMRLDLYRWYTDGSQLAATVERTGRDYVEVYDEWYELRLEHESLLKVRLSSKSVAATVSTTEAPSEAVLTPVSSMREYHGMYIPKIYKPRELGISHPH